MPSRTSTASNASRTAQWLAGADSLAADLRARGVAPGDVVAFWLSSCIDYAVAYAACTRLGAVATGINTRLGPGEVTAILQRCEPVALLHEGDTFAIPGGAPTPKVMMPRAEVAAAWTAGNELTDRPRRDPGDPVCIVWTSGTTGLPKGAWFDHRAMEASARLSNILSAYHDVRLMPVPFPHAGYMNKLWDQVEFVINSVLTGTPWTVESMLDGMVRERVTVGQGVPTQWSKLVDLPAAAPTSTCRRCGSRRPGRRRSRPSWPRRCAPASAARSWSATRAPSRRRSPAPASTIRPRCCCTPSADRRTASSSCCATKVAHRCPTVRSAWSRCVPRAACAATGTTPSAPPTRSRPTAGSPPATSGACATTATSCCAVAPARCTSAAASTSTRSRSSACVADHPKVATGGDRRDARAHHRRDRRGVRGAGRPGRSADAGRDPRLRARAARRLQGARPPRGRGRAADDRRCSRSTSASCRPAFRRSETPVRGPRPRRRGSAGSPARRRCGSTPSSRPG